MPEWKTLYAEEAAQQFAESGKVQNIGGVTVADDSPSQGTWRKRKGVLFEHKNLEKGYQKGKDKFLMKLYLFVSDDGAKLLNVYRKIQPRSDEFFIFLENDEDKNTGQVMRVATGSKIKKYADADLLYQWINSEYEISRTQLVSLINEGLSSDFLFQKAFEWVGETYLEAKSFSNEISIAGWSKIIGLFENAFRYEESDWNHEHAEYSPPFLLYHQVKEKKWSVNTLQRAALLGTGLVTAATTAGYVIDAQTSLVRQINKQYTEISSTFQTFIAASDLIPEVFRGYLIATHETFDSIFTSLLNFLKQEGEFIQQLFQIEGQLLNAFLCGVLNGILDMISGLFYLMKLFYQGMNEVENKVKDIPILIETALELYDNYQKGVKGFNWDQYFKEMLAPLKELANLGFSGIWEKFKGLNMTEIAYYTGYVTINILEVFIPYAALAKGLEAFGDAGKFVGKAIQFYEEIFAAIGMAFSVVGKKFASAIDQVIYLVQELTRMLSKGVDEVLKFIREVVERIKRWLDDVRIKEFLDGGTHRSPLLKTVSKILDNAPLFIKNAEKAIQRSENEILYIWKEGLENLEPITSNLVRKVKLTKEQVKNLKDAIVTHNHPSSSSMSLADIERFLEHGIKELRVIGKDGSLYSLKRIKKIGFFEKRNMVSKARKLVVEEISSSGESLSKSQFRYKVVDKIIELLDTKVKYVEYT